MKRFRIFRYQNCFPLRTIRFVREDDEEFQNPVDLMFEDLNRKKPNTFAYRQYRLYKLAAGVICSR